MRKLAFVVSLMAGAGCTSSTGSTDQNAAFLGEWSGQGFSVENQGTPTYAPAPGANAATSPVMASFKRLAFTTDASGAAGIAGVYPVVAVSTKPVPMVGFGGGSLFVDAPFTVSGPTYASCADTPCQDRTDTVTVTGGSASLADGQLWVTLAGQRVNCCQPAAFTVAFVGTRSGSSD